MEFLERLDEATFLLRGFRQWLTDTSKFIIRLKIIESFHLFNKKHVWNYLFTMSDFHLRAHDMRYDVELTSLSLGISSLCS